MRCIYTKVANSYSKKIRQKNLTPRVPPFKVTDGVPLAVGYRRLGSEKNTMIGLPGGEKFDDKFSRLEYNTRVGRTDTGRQQLPSLRIASRGKNKTSLLRFYRFFKHYLQLLSISKACVA